MNDREVNVIGPASRMYSGVSFKSVCLGLARSLDRQGTRYQTATALVLIWHRDILSYAFSCALQYTHPTPGIYLRLHSTSLADPMPSDIFRQAQTEDPQHVLALCILGQTLPPIPASLSVLLGLDERSTAADAIARFEV